MATTTPSRTTAVVLAAVLATGLLTTNQTDVASATPAPQACEDIAGLSKAPVLTGDRTTAGTTINDEAPLQDGTAIPVVMVHGWTGNSEHTDERTGAFSHLIDLTVSDDADSDGLPTSLIGAIQSVGGVSVYTFDYHDLASRWVTDEGIGPALADSLTCLAQAYEHPAIVVAHSMGGLATRQALGLIAEDADLGSPAEYVSDVITYGTPNTGSEVARFLVDTTAGLGSMEGMPDAETATALHSLIVVCGAVATESLDDLGACGVLGELGASIGSEAVQGLASGSDQLAALAPWPNGVNVHGYAGDVTVSLGASAWFFDLYETESASLGDLIVPRPSALDGASDTQTNECPYTIDVNVVGPVWDQGLSVDDLALLGAGKSGCFHGNLMRTAELAFSTTAIVSQVVQDAQAIIASGFPPELAGEWCSRLDEDADCWSVQGLLEEFPGAFVEAVDESPDTPGATRVFICLVNDLDDSCSMAATMIAEYYPVGVEWNCEEYAASHDWPGCEPDYTDAHDATEPRLAIIPNHQHSPEFVDAEPLYRR